MADPHIPPRGGSDFRTGEAFSPPPAVAASTPTTSSLALFRKRFSDALARRLSAPAYPQVHPLGPNFCESAKQYEAWSARHQPPQAQPYFKHHSTPSISNKNDDVSPSTSLPIPIPTIATSPTTLRSPFLNLYGGRTSSIWSTKPTSTSSQASSSEWSPGTSEFAPSSATPSLLRQWSSTMVSTISSSSATDLLAGSGGGGNGEKAGRNEKRASSPAPPLTSMATFVASMARAPAADTGTTSSSTASLEPRLQIGQACAHEQHWSRVRSKKGYNHFKCELCGNKWRIMTNKRRAEL